MLALRVCGFSPRQVCARLYMSSSCIAHDMESSLPRRKTCDCAWYDVQGSEATLASYKNSFTMRMASSNANHKTSVATARQLAARWPWCCPSILHAACSLVQSAPRHILQRRRRDVPKAWHPYTGQRCRDCGACRPAIVTSVSQKRMSHV